MERLMLRLRNRCDLSEIEKYAVITYVSPVINLINVEIEAQMIHHLNDIENVLRVTPEATGQLMTP